MPLLLDPGGRPAAIPRTRVDRPRRGENPRDASARVVGRSPRTLDDVLSEAWEGLLGDAPARCPVCDGDLAARWSAGAGVVGGRCGNCGSELG